jgi:hypothetical protein
MARKSPESIGPRNERNVVRRAGFPPLAFGGNAAAYDTRTREVLDQDTRDLDARLSPTVIDLRSLPRDASDPKILEWTAKWLKVSLSELRANGSTERSQELYRKLNQSLLMAADYMRGTLRLARQLDHMFRDGMPPVLNSSDDLIALLRKTVHFEEEKTGLSTHALYCAFVSVAIAAFDGIEHGVENLIGEAQYVEREFTRTADDHEPLFGVYDVGGGNERKFSNMYGGVPVRGSFEVRGKSLSSFFTKWLSRPETSSETALKDGIGVRLTVRREDVLEASMSLVTFLQEQFGAYDFKFENDNLFDQKVEGDPEGEDREFEHLQKALMGQFDFSDSQFSRNKPSASSSGRFQAFKIVGTLEVPSGGKGGAATESRRFEVQIVLPYNKNERKSLSHSVYDVVRKVSVMTRILGSCEESLYEEYVEEAARQSGMDVATIHDALVNGRNGRLIVHKGKTRRTGTRYVVASQYARRQLLDLGDDPALFREILREKAAPEDEE